MKRIFTVFLFSGCLMLAFSFYRAWTESHFEKNALHTMGWVVNLGLERNEGRRIWYPVVAYYDRNGKQNEFTLSVGSEGYRTMLGQNVEVLYLPDEPDEARISGFEGQYVDSLVAGIFGFSFTLIGALAPLLMRSHQSHAQRLMLEGKPVEATIIGAVINSTDEVNGQSPWRIVCQCEDKAADKTYLFHSENIYFDPTPWIKKRRRAVVYLDSHNIKKYYVDISWLPEQSTMLKQRQNNA